MASLYYVKKSPFYWIRYYDPFETDPDPNKKRKKFCTKVPLTLADQRRVQEAEQQKAKGKSVKLKLQGCPEVRDILKGFEGGLVELKIKKLTGVTLKKRLYLSDAFAQFKKDHSVPGSRNFKKLKTLQGYDTAVDHLIEAAGDKYIHKYSREDYNSLLFYFEDKASSINTRSIYTRNLHTLWGYFVKQGWVSGNVMEATEGEEKDPDPIPLKDLFKILQYLKKRTDYPHWFQIVYFMLLTGCRPSSAIVQLKKDIDQDEKVITIRNVKAGRAKGKQYYKFSLYPELRGLIKDILKDSPKGEKRLFYMYSVVEENYTWPLSFWDRAILELLKDKDKDGKKKEPEISRSYSLKQLRSTLASFLFNALHMDIFTVQKMLDHANIKITEKHYVSVELKNIYDHLSSITYEHFNPENSKKKGPQKKSYGRHKK